MIATSMLQHSSIAVKRIVDYFGSQGSGEVSLFSAARRISIYTVDRLTGTDL
jgi:hypothetical protein